MDDRFAHTRQALAIYVLTEPERRAAWNRAENEDDVVDCIQADEQARLEVCHAFYLDTKDVNSWDRCKLLSVGDATQMVESWDVKYGAGTC